MPYGRVPLGQARQLPAGGQSRPEGAGATWCIIITRVSLYAFSRFRRFTWSFWRRWPPPLPTRSLANLLQAVTTAKLGYNPMELDPEDMTPYVPRLCLGRRQRLPRLPRVPRAC